MEKRRVRSEVDRREVYHGRQNKLHPAVSQDVQSVWAAGVSHLPQHNFSCPSYKYTKKKTKNCTPRTNFQSSSESNKGQPFSLPTTKQRH